MTTFGNAIDYVKDKASQGVEFPFGQNAEVVRMTGLRVIVRIPAAVRKELNDAVRAGYLGKLKKSGLAPEIYYHPNSRHRAIDEQRKILLKNIESIKNICI